MNKKELEERLAETLKELHETSKELTTVKMENNKLLDYNDELHEKLEKNELKGDETGKNPKMLILKELAYANKLKELELTSTSRITPESIKSLRED